MPDTFRVHRRVKYASIPNAIIEDNTLSAVARLALIWAISRPDNWVFHLSHAATVLCIGQNKVEKAFRELRDAGYVRHEGQIRAGGKWGASVYIVHDEPQKCDISTAPPKWRRRNGGAVTEAPTKTERKMDSNLVWISQLDPRWPRLIALKGGKAMTDRRGGWHFPSDHVASVSD